MAEHMDMETTAVVVEEPVVRLVPDMSLAEEALAKALDTVEALAGIEGTTYITVIYDEAGSPKTVRMLQQLTSEWRSLCESTEEEEGDMGDQHAHLIGKDVSWTA